MAQIGYGSGRHLLTKDPRLVFLRVGTPSRETNWLRQPVERAIAGKKSPLGW
jgi:hypothetical protein